MTEWQRIKALGGIGILTKADIHDLNTQKMRVLWLMMDGCWHQAGEVINVSGGREGLRRLRELREIPNVAIERKAHPSAASSSRRDFMYKLIYTPGIQREMF